MAEFIEHRLPSFGLYQDAMWRGEAWLYHSHLSCALNLKLLNPREVIADAQATYFGAPIDDKSLTPGADPIIGTNHY